MPYPLTITVTPPAGAPAPGVSLSLSFLGQQQQVDLLPDGSSLGARLDLPSAPRYLRLQAHCGDDQDAPGCLDELVMMDSIHQGRLHYSLVQVQGGSQLVRTEGGGPPLAASFAWGLLMVAALGLLWWRGGRDASP